MKISISNKFNHITILRYLMVLCILALSARIFHQYLLSDANDTNYFIFIWLIIYTYTFTQLFVFSKFSIHNNQFIPLYVFIGFCFLSSLWSTNFITSTKESITLLGCLIIAINFYATGRSLSIQKYFFTFLKVTAVVSLFLIIFFPEAASNVEKFADAWNGVFPHKNYFGRLMALLFLLSIFLFKGINKIIYSLLSLVLVFLSTSVGAIFVILALLPLLYFIKIISKFKNNQKIAIFFVGLFIGTITILSLYLNFENFLGAFNKDSTLTGRTDLWYIAMKFIAAAPILGYGYGAFWTGEGSIGEKFILQASWEAPHAHNGYIDLTLEIGVFGLIIFILMLFYIIKRSLTLYFKTGDIFPLLVFLYLIVENFAEKVITVGNDFHWILFCACYVYTIYGLKRGSVNER
jgi:exopolysaccharide production protein ExoQ